MLIVCELLYNTLQCIWGVSVVYCYEYQQNLLEIFLLDSSINRLQSPLYEATLEKLAPAVISLTFIDKL